MVAIAIGDFERGPYFFDTSQGLVPTSKQFALAERFDELLDSWDLASVRDRLVIEAELSLVVSEMLVLARSDRDP